MGIANAWSQWRGKAGRHTEGPVVMEDGSVLVVEVRVSFVYVAHGALRHGAKSADDSGRSRAASLARPVRLELTTFRSAT